MKVRYKGLFIGLCILLLVAWLPDPGLGQIVWAQDPTPEHETEAMPELSPVELAEGEKLKVVATTTIVGDVVARIGGDRIDLKVLMPIGVDSHTYDPVPADAAAVSDAHVMFINGVGLEEFLKDFDLGGELPVVPVSVGIRIREGRAHEPGDEHVDAMGDPHVWFDVQNVMIWVENVEHALGELEPAGAAVYEENAHSYRHKLEELDAWIVEEVALVPEENRQMVTSHETLGYFCDRYGFEMVGTVFPVTTAAGPSAQDLAKLEEAIKEAGVKAIFVEATVNPTLAERVAEDTGIEVVMLYTGSLGPEGSGAENYPDYMRYDVTAIVEALK